MIENIIEVAGMRYRAGAGDAFHLSIPLLFNGPQPNAFGAPPARSEACMSGSLIGDTRRGGSCNFDSISLIPHCNGTHTECVGHITHERISVRDCLRDTFIPALLVSVEPERQAGGDLVIGWELLEAGVDRTASSDTRPAALIVRTIPNDHDKLTRSYDGDAMPPYLAANAVRWIVDTGFKHLLVDLPSIDRLNDGGSLEGHRIFWKVDEGSDEISPETRVESTITELIYVPSDVPDGEYLLNLQIPPFEADAAPSRPIIFPLA